MKVVLGRKYRDTITGFEGTAVGATTWIHQCRRIGLQAANLNKEGKVLEVEWFDEPGLVTASTGKPVTDTTTPKKTGGPPARGVETG